jgi:hypothetical protein
MQSGWAGSRLAGHDLDTMWVGCLSTSGNNVDVLAGCDLDRLAVGRLDMLWTSSPSGH